ncbi:Mitochondrial intermembrane space cysteine motif-containing protein MIX17 [Choanephora cucurbitarum]|uniref:Mitochondrial intermembrane space cysteine motif-containing protein MIX17 n=1 Tax=Choanephora cucurbitarum TaxID=101091 RepID=A0A1C7NG20_9FUNG|nr:Mitochondrial intermembrane space cysteine motif-containing protein MIX17 [Choanephora cucurbitarum]
MARSRQTRRAGPTQQTRSAHTMPARQTPPAQQHQVPSQQHQAPPQQPAIVQGRQPGLFSQMASTAAGVAVGSAVGHSMANGVSAMFGSSSEPQSQEPQAQQQQPMAAQTQNGASCEADARAFTQCLEATDNDMSACKWYLDALKQCQQMASQY